MSCFPNVNFNQALVYRCACMHARARVWDCVQVCIISSIHSLNIYNKARNGILLAAATDK